MNNKRLSNIELLRILCIVLILSMHSIALVSATFCMAIIIDNIRILLLGKLESKTILIILEGLIKAKKYFDSKIKI